MGKYYVLIALGVGFAAVNTGNNLLYLVFGMLMSFIILSGSLSESSLKGLCVQRIPPKHIYARRPFLMGLSVTNPRRFFPSFSIEIEDIMGGLPLDKRLFFLKIPPGRTYSASYRYQIPKRGSYSFQGLRISTRFPFGLFQKSRYLVLPMDVVVLPRTEPIGCEDLAMVDPGGEASLGQPGRGGDFYGLKEFRQGNDPRDIHWRSSAKVGRPILKEHEDDAGKRVTVVLNNVLGEQVATVGDQDGVEGRTGERKSGRVRKKGRKRNRGADGAKERVVLTVEDWAVDFAASLCAQFLLAGYRVGLLTSRDVIKPSMGEYHLMTILHTLALVPFEDGNSSSAQTSASLGIAQVLEGSHTEADGGVHRAQRWWGTHLQDWGNRVLVTPKGEVVNPDVGPFLRVFELDEEGEVT